MTWEGPPWKRRGGETGQWLARYAIQKEAFLLHFHGTEDAENGKVDKMIAIIRNLRRGMGGGLRVPAHSR